MVQTRHRKAAEGVCEVYDMIRIETTCDRYLYRENLGFDEMMRAFDRHVEEHIRKRKIVCMKSAVGYYTGLKWEPVFHDEAEKNYNQHYLGYFHPKRRDKKFRDYMVYHGLELCVKHGMNFQMHTGAGDPPKCDMRLINPNDLYELINTDLAKQVHFVVVHGGFRTPMRRRFWQPVIPMCTRTFSPHRTMREGASDRPDRDRGS